MRWRFRNGAGHGRIEERFLHCASRRVRRSEHEEKAPARSGRNDSFEFWLMADVFPVLVVEADEDLVVELVWRDG